MHPPRPGLGAWSGSAGPARRGRRHVTWDVSLAWLVNVVKLRSSDLLSSDTLPRPQARCGEDTEARMAAWPGLAAGGGLALAAVAWGEYAHFRAAGLGFGIAQPLAPQSEAVSARLQEQTARPR